MELSGMTVIKTAFDSCTEAVRRAEEGKIQVCDMCKEYLNQLLAGKVLIEKQTSSAFPPLYAYEFGKIADAEIKFNEKGELASGEKYVDVSIRAYLISLNREGNSYGCTLHKNDSIIDLRLYVETGKLGFVSWCGNECTELEVITFGELTGRYRLEGYDIHNNRFNIGDTVTFSLLPAKAETLTGRIIGRQAHGGKYTCLTDKHEWNVSADSITCIEKQ